MIKNAYFSDCTKYRYWLLREWDVELPKIIFVGLNPSTADHINDDPTTRRCINFAIDYRYGGMYMLNLFALRSTDPKGLKLVTDPVGDINKETFYNIVNESQTVVCAWGTKGEFLHQDKNVLKWLNDSKASIKCLEITKNGHPKHPLYVAKNTELKNYE